MIILDCTLRDGGYYNNWDFDDQIVNAYLLAMANSGINVVELGLRNFSQNGFFGAFAYTTEGFLNNITLPKGPKYGVMIDAKTIINSSLQTEEAINALFVPANESKINVVRIAAHFREVEASFDIAKQLKALGYYVGFNLMQAGGKASAVIREKAKTIESWNMVDVLYFADSLGNMDGKEVTRIVSALKAHWTGDLGIHTHDNMGRGLDNTLIAHSLGVEWIDSTVTGMGRGAGNTATEKLFAVFSRDSSLYHPKPIYDLVIRHFEKMQKEKGWGSNLLYFLGAQNNVHPTYIQNLLADPHYGPDEIVGAIDYLSGIEGTESYNGETLNVAVNHNTKSIAISGSEQLKGAFKDSEVLILNNGPSLAKYKGAIIDYIVSRRPIVLAVNFISVIPQQYVDYFCLTHNTKFLSESGDYSSISKPIVLPKHRFHKSELVAFNTSCVDFGMEIRDGAFHANASYCSVPYDLTIAYALALAYSADSRTISLVGVDGYEASDPRHLEMIDLLEKAQALFASDSIAALTPTTYPIAQKSVYAPIE
ncbi:aldolase catalytic domain-containing protein [Ningiella sp. W23]|uniref:aldolase catalytic domain-containing protein n=1 Tax=Ningiella sp. W23 TaxID=3023715 RepID=UPI0037576D96